MDQVFADDAAPSPAPSLARVPGAEGLVPDQPVLHAPLGVDLSVSLAKIVAVALDMARAAHGALVLFDDADRIVECVLLDRDDVIGRSTAADAALADDLIDRGDVRVTELIGSPASALGELGEIAHREDTTRRRNIDGLLGAPAPFDRVRSVAAVPVRIRGAFTGSLVIADPIEDRPFDEESAHLLFALAAAVTAAVENDLLYAEMQRRQRWLEASTEVTTRILSGAQATDVLRLIARRVQECTPADGVAILLMAEDGRMVVEYATGEASELFSGMVADDSWASSANAITTGRPVVIPDLGASRRSEHPAFRRLGACMLLPMRAADQTLGAIAVANYRDHRRFDPTDLAMAEAFAGQTALASVLSEARTERERLLVFEERDRIARDLHDLVIQRLFATGMMLQGAGRGGDLPPDAADRVSRAVDELDATVREIRQTIFALNQPADPDMVSSLRGRILHEVATAVPALGFHPHLRMAGAVDTVVPDEVANQLVAATREALSNVARHAHATKVDVTMEIRGDEVYLEIVDDGVGIGDSTRSSGLRNLRVRASTIGGWCATWPSKPDGTGTRLTFKAPITFRPPVR